MATIRIKGSSRKITPEAGCLLAGYGPRVYSNGVHDDLLVSALALDDGETRVLLLSFDLLGLDRDFVEQARRSAADSAGIKPESVILTCTHTHSGPHTRRMANLKFDAELQQEFEAYRDFLMAEIGECVQAIFSEMTETEVYYYSAKCNENINRRVILPDNKCVSLPQNKHLMGLADNLTDPELGLVYFVDAVTRKPVLTLVNYAAHPLTCQSEGESALKISADYPGVLRDCVETELGGQCIFTQGACGDLYPVGFESGFTRTHEMGQAIARQVVQSFSDALWNPGKYRLDDVSVKMFSENVTVDFRTSGGVEERLPLYKGAKEVTLEIQTVTIGDIALVGVPGELLCGPGLEIKWHSPYRKTFILYNSTAYISYISPANAFVQGGYEAETSHLAPDVAFKIVSCALKLLHR